MLGLTIHHYKGALKMFIKRYGMLTVAALTLGIAIPATVNAANTNHHLSTQLLKTGSKHSTNKKSNTLTDRQRQHVAKIVAKKTHLTKETDGTIVETYKDADLYGAIKKVNPKVYKQLTSFADNLSSTNTSTRIVWLEKPSNGDINVFPSQNSAMLYRTLGSGYDMLKAEYNLAGGTHTVNLSAAYKHIQKIVTSPIAATPGSMITVRNWKSVGIEVPNKTLN